MAPLVQFLAEGVCSNRLGVLDAVGVVSAESKLARGGGTKAASYVGDPAVVCIARRIRGSAWVRL